MIRRCESLALKLLSYLEDEISSYILGFLGGTVGMASCQGQSQQWACGFAQLPKLSGHEGGRSENMEPRFSGNLYPPCPDHFQRSVFTARPGSVQFPSRFGVAGKQDEVLELSAPPPP